MIRFSVVIPCYNAGPYVAGALRSVAGQTVAAQEVIVVDDGSTDDSLAAVEASGVEVTLLRTGGGAGGSGARNVGIRAATGEWVAFLDADDLWHPDHLERVQRLVEGTGDVGCLNHIDVMSAAVGEGGGGDIERHRRQLVPLEREEARTGLTHTQYLELYAKTTSFVGMTACCIRRDRLIEVGGFDESQRRRHDIELWLRVIRGRTWSYDPHPSTVYRRGTPGSVSSNYAARELDHLRALLKNREGYGGVTYDRVLRILAKRAVATAMTDGDAEQRREAIAEAWGYLPRRDRLIFGAARVWPAGFAALNHVRRRHAAPARRRPAPAVG